MKRGYVFCLAAALFFYALALNAAEVMQIGMIRVKGNRRIETDTILAQIKTAPGDDFSPQALREDLIAIYKTGFFEDVQVDVSDFEGKLLVTFIVKEKPSIKEIEVVGCEEIKEEKVREKISARVNTIVDESVLEQDAAAIRKLYEEEGYYLAKVQVEQERVDENWVVVRYVIDEGPEVRIEEIRFVGNEAFSEDELEDVLETTEYWFFSWLTGSGHLDREELDKDLDRLLAFYYDHGYIDAQVGSPQIELSEDKEKLYITIPIVEGKQYKVRSVGVKGNMIFTEDELLELLRLRPGDTFSRQVLRKDIESLTERYAKEGYLLTEVYPTTRKHPEEQTLDVVLNIEEGKMTYVRYINIKGNQSTRDKVIRRELIFDEGDVLTSFKLRRSYNRVNNLGFFEQVKLNTKPTEEENYLDVELEVKERLTGAISLGAGWSSVDKLVGTVSISQGNLFGLGQRLMLSGTFGGTTQNYNLSFTEPWLFDVPLTVGFDVYYKTARSILYRNYDIDRKGGDVFFSYPLAEYTRMYWKYMYELVNVYDVEEDAPLVIKEREGEKATSLVSFALVRDSRDNRLRPTEGSRNRVSVEVAGGPLGGDNYFVRTIGESSWHFPLFWKFVLSLRGVIGYETSYAGREVPLEELFRLGGDRSVRGFDSGSIDPRVDDEVIGGNKELIFNAEIHFPLIDPLAGVIFFDTGGAFAEDESFALEDMREGAGVGIRFFTPVGPIRLDWGYKLDRQPGESTYEWHFAIGTYF